MNALEKLTIEITSDLSSCPTFTPTCAAEDPVYWRNAPDWEPRFQLDQANYCAERAIQWDAYGNGYNWYNGTPFTGVADTSF